MKQPKTAPLTNTFDLEQGILNCWNICEDLQLVLDSWDNMSDQAKFDLLFSLKKLYHLKFENTFEKFEACLRK